MLRSRIALLAAALLLASCSDPEKEANTLSVEAAGLVQRASSEGPVAKLAALGQANAKIAEIVGEKYASTAAAMKVASGERLGGMNQGEIEAAIAAARLTPEVCAVERTRECTVAAAVRGAKAGAASTDPDTNQASWLTLAMLQSTDGAPGVDEVKAAIGASRWFKERNVDIDDAANDVVARSLDTVARRDGLAAAVDRLNLLLRSTTGENQRWLRLAGWDALAREIDLARDADLVVDEVAMLSDEDRSRIASSVIPGYVSKPEEAERLYAGIMKLAGYLGPARRTSVLESLARHVSRERLMDIADIAPDDAARAKLVYAHLSSNRGDIAPVEFLSLYRILPPAERRMLRDSLPSMAVDPKVDGATSEVLLETAESDAHMDAKDTDTQYRQPSPWRGPSAAPIPTGRSPTWSGGSFPKGAAGRRRSGTA